MKRTVLFLAVFVTSICSIANVAPLQTNPHVNKTVYVDAAVIDFPQLNTADKTVFHLVSHGRPGELLVNGQWLNARQIAQLLNDKIDRQQTSNTIRHLYIYGCEFGKGETGKAAVSYLEKALGITVSASDDITGKDGDWELEVGAAIYVKGFDKYKANLQTISGVINSYAAVSAIAGTTITVDATTGFNAGQKILVIQMQGATINTSNSASYGQMLSTNGTGYYEFATVTAVTGTTITISAPLTKTYNMAGSVQVVSVPVYTGTTTVSASLTGAAWNGTNKGGVLVFEADQLVLTNDITMTGKGFMGGQQRQTSANSVDYVSVSGASKGQGIAKFTAGDRLAGSQFNGGGGGNWTNTGGGGGANYGTGGSGGKYSSATDIPGRGGLTMTCGPKLLMMGGGGGAGDQNDGAGSIGADGGGIIIIKANAITGNSRTIESKGNNAANSTNDGAGGGGAAGALVLLGNPSFTGNLTINLNGGNGGTSTSAHGAGGGGGGGHLIKDVTLPGTVTVTLTGGAAGTGSGLTPAAQAGQAGGTSIVTSTIPEVAANQAFEYKNGILSGLSDPGNTIVDVIPAGSATSYSISANPYVSISNSGQLTLTGTPGFTDSDILYVTVTGPGGTSCPAQIKIYNTTDTDGDGVRDADDIDDDNDGILDAIESVCTTPVYTSKTGVTVSSTLTWNGSLSTLLDGADVTNQTYPNAASIAGESVLEFSFPNSITLKEIELTAYSTQTAIVVGAVVQMKGWNGSSWVNISSPITVTTPTTSTANPAQLSYKFSITNTLPYTKYRIEGVSGSVQVAWLQEAYFSEFCLQQDTDNDGIPNRLDLDSDGDGCPDALEAGVAGNAGTSGAMNASGGALYSGGITTGTANAYVGNGTPVQYGANGFFNGIETSSESGGYNGTYTYNYAIGSNYAACRDTDGDGTNDITDIDDDNDGVVDAVESPSCFYTAAEMAVPASVSSEIPTTQTIANLYDNNATSTFAFTSTTAANALGKTIFEITPVYPQAATAIVLNLNTATSPIGALSATATLRAEGWNGSSWVALATYTATQAVAADKQTFAFTNTTVYTKYRLFESGTNGVAISTNAIQEVKLVMPAGYVPSANPKPTCATDTDGDGIPNHLDLDSDGDGCSDLKEAGVSPATDVSTPSSTTNNAGTSYGIAANKLSGSQLNPSATDSNDDGLNDSVDPDLNGATNYNLTYLDYAINQGANLCLDTDADGALDVNDIDDDNDGILDIVESPDCFYKASDIKFVSASTTLTDYSTNPSYSFTELYDGVLNDLAAFGNLGTAVAGESVYEMGLNFPAELSGADVVFQYSIFQTGATFKWQGFDGGSWTDVTGVLTATQGTNNTNTYTFNPTGKKYTKYRVLGISGLLITTAFMRSVQI